MADSAKDHGNHAGPYGFTRREAFVLTAIIAISMAVIAFDIWREGQNPEKSAWLIEDVLVQAPATLLMTDSSEGLAETKSQARPTRDYSDLIDVNSADARTLARLPGIGAELARRIIAERESTGRFLSLTDLQRVNGIGPRKAAMLSGWVKFSGHDAPKSDTIQSDSADVE